MSKNRESDDDVKLHSTIRNRQIANSVWIVLRAVAVVVQEMSARISPLTLLHYVQIQIEAPVVFVIDAIPGAAEKRADITAEVQNFSTLPHWPSKHFVEVTKLRWSGRDKVPRERARFSEERSVGGNK